MRAIVERRSSTSTIANYAHVEALIAALVVYAG